MHPDQEQVRMLTAEHVREMLSLLLPDQEQVRMLTAEHVREMLSLLLDVAYLKHCAKRQVLPQSSRVPRSSQIREQLQSKIAADIECLMENYEGCIAAYADAFGFPAADRLDAYVRHFVGSAPSDEPAVQRNLF